jgi:glyoxylase-like metal-dependent hydrolase (beta-lactamase superfamily II)
MTKSTRSDIPIRLRILDGGHMLLDGGTMFGVIPRVNWQKLIPPDEQNRIRLACWCVLAEIGEKRVLIEAGLGDKYSEKERSIYGLTGSWVAPALEAVGVSCDSIDQIILTHLHFDHAGGLTRFNGELPDEGPQQLVFPNAEVVVQDGEWRDALDNYSTTRSSYRTEELEPVRDAGKLKLVNGDVEIGGGIRVRVTPGHTRYHQSVILTGPNRTACFVGELLPTVYHARPAYQMAYDVLPIETMRSKAALMQKAEADNWLLILDHDPDHPAVTVSRDERTRFALTDAADHNDVLSDWVNL